MVKMSTLPVKQSYSGTIQPSLHRFLSLTWQSCPLQSFKWAYARFLWVWAKISANGSKSTLE